MVREGSFGGVQIISADYRQFDRLDPLGRDWCWGSDLALPRAVLRRFGITKGIDIFLASEIPPGTGLGSSGAVAVAMIKALSEWTGQEMSRDEIAELACQIEIEDMCMPVGKQDQYAATYGGLNTILFSRDSTKVIPVECSRYMRETLESHLLLFFTGHSRKSSTILHKQRESSGQDGSVTVKAIGELKDVAVRMLGFLRDGVTFDYFGQLLHEAWEYKKLMASGITTPGIDIIYDLARTLGALGGKITGAGGGGHLMLFASPVHHPTITGALEDVGLRRLHFKFDMEGVKVC